MNYKLKITSLGLNEIEGYDYPYEEFVIPDYDYEKDKVEEVGSYECGQPLQIDKVINSLMEIKNKGANFVSCDYHIDHGSLLIEGLIIEEIKANEITKEEIEIINKQIEKYKEDIHYHNQQANKFNYMIDQLKEKLK